MPDGFRMERFVGDDEEASAMTASLQRSLDRRSEIEKIDNTYCATGKGGGIDPGCGDGKGKTSSRGEPMKKAVRGPEKGDKWKYEDGSALPKHLAKLAIPPAWKDVYVNPNPKGTVLASGVDSKGRSQNKYSDTHVAKAAAAKFGRVTELLKKRARIFQELESDAKNVDLRDRAHCLKLIMQTGMRPGGSETLADFKSYGATTLEGRHVIPNADGSVTLRLVTGKNKGKEVDFPVVDKSTASMLQQRAKAAGADGKLFDVDAHQLREYSKEQNGKGFKTKDHRTAVGTETAIETVKNSPEPTNLKEYKARIKEVATVVAKTLGNTPAVAIKSYIDPQVFVAWKKKAGVQ